MYMPFEPGIRIYRISLPIVISEINFITVRTFRLDSLQYPPKPALFGT